MAELIKLSGFLLQQNHHPLEGTIAASGSAVLPVSLCLHKGFLLAAVSTLPRYAPGRCRCVGSFPSLAKRCDGDLGIHTVLFLNNYYLEHLHSPKGRLLFRMTIE